MKIWLEIEVKHSTIVPTGDEVACAIESFDVKGLGWQILAVKPAVERVTNRVPSGYISMEECRNLASTYSGGEGHHPLARHRDSMG